MTPEEFSTRGIHAKYDYARRKLGGGVGACDYRQIDSLNSETFEGDLQILLDRLACVGVSEVVAVDLSKPEYDLPVVRVVVPGLEAPHDDEGYMAGPRALTTREQQD